VWIVEPTFALRNQEDREGPTTIYQTYPYGTNLSYDERLNLLGLERLELRRLFLDLYMAHNILIYTDVF